jgi:hypothetical protein
MARALAMRLWVWGKRMEKGTSVRGRFFWASSLVGDNEGQEALKAAVNRSKNSASFAVLQELC